MDNSEYFCPVPKDQRPLNEYKKLKESNNFLWCIQNKKGYLQSLFSIYSVAFIFSTLVLFASSFSVKDMKYFLLYSTTAGTLIVTIFCLRSYLGWQYIYSRLMEATVSYEESGWYDGQVWVKPPEVLLQDRLIGTYEISPAIIRLQITIVALFFLFFICLILAKNT